MQASAAPGKGLETHITLLYSSIYSILLMYHLVRTLLAYYTPLSKEQLCMYVLYTLWQVICSQTMKTDPDHLFMDS
jgi:hypothetical protein